MKATDILRGEHVLIEQVLDCLERIADEAEESGRVDGEAARPALAFLVSFADGCHHAKEEHYLFPLMEERGYSREGGPTGMMLYEHEEGRREVRNMDAALDFAELGRKAAVADFIRHARRYIALLRHLSRWPPNRLLFPHGHDIRCHFERHGPGESLGLLGHVRPTAGLAG